MNQEKEIEEFKKLSMNWRKAFLLMYATMTGVYIWAFFYVGFHTKDLILTIMGKEVLSNKLVFDGIVVFIILLIMMYIILIIVSIFLEKLIYVWKAIK